MPNLAYQCRAIIALEYLPRFAAGQQIPPYKQFLYEHEFSARMASSDVFGLHCVLGGNTSQAADR
jgi:hypothetical protein